ASFSNDPLGGSAYMLGATSSDTPQGSLALQAIHYTQVSGGSVNGAMPFYPILGGAEDNFGDGTAQKISVPPYQNPLGVPQSGPAPLFVGDDRPQRVIYREGHLYDARVVASPSPLNSTVFYDVIQTPSTN